MSIASESEIEDFLGSHPAWDRSGIEISRTYVFSDFSEAMAFVTRIAIASEVADHHPDIDIRWNKVICTLSTHSAGSLTGKDLRLASTFDDYAS